MLLLLGLFAQILPLACSFFIIGIIAQFINYIKFLGDVVGVWFLNFSCSYCIIFNEK